MTQGARAAAACEIGRQPLRPALCGVADPETDVTGEKAGAAPSLHRQLLTRRTCCLTTFWAMGKSKTKGSKPKSVFHVASTRSLKAKNKAKPVTTSLKKINIVNDERVRTVNKAFTEVQKEVKQLSKGISSKSQERPRVSKHLEGEPADVDAAASLLSHL